MESIEDDEVEANDYEELNENELKFGIDKDLHQKYIVSLLSHNVTRPWS